MAKESKESIKEKNRRKLALQKKYSTRITIAKQGREAFLSKDYVNATKKYNEYLGILAEMNEVEDIFKITPAMFDSKKHVTEMLLISHVYWELARINEMTPKLQPNFQKALTQFVKFTVNQPYQVLNAEMLRKYIKKNKNVSAQISGLYSAHSQIYVESKKCYIATFCFGEESSELVILRKFKNTLTNSSLGISFIRIYYNHSSKLVDLVQNKNLLAIFFIKLSKYPLRIFAKILKGCIFK